MEIKDFELLCRKLSLGPLQILPVKIEGGLLHKMWKIHAGRRFFAVKELDARIMPKPGIRFEYQKSEEFSGVIRNLGVCTPKVVKHHGQILHDVGSAVTIVYEWVDGKTLPLSKIGRFHA